MSEETNDLMCCPFCGSFSLEIFEDDQTNDKVNFIFCEDCLAQGGEGRTLAVAKILWNTRYQG